jgi:hypothetical protein
MKCFPFYIVNIGSAALRSVALYFFIATAATVCAQDFDRTDATIQLYPETFDEVAQFDRFLSRDFNTDEEKVRAIYSWLINNISYDPDAYKLFNYNFKDYRERNQKEERSRKKIIEHTLRTGKAVCEGYAMTFEKLLTLQGIDNYLIQGDTKTHFKDIDRKFDLSHMWNAIKIDDSWYLFDTTWGAGKYTSKFVKEPSYYYYQIAPSEFIKTHYPEDITDAFVANPPAFETFSQQPIYIVSSLALSAYATSYTGIIDSAQQPDELEFGFKETPSQIGYAYDGEMLPVNAIQESGEGVYFTIPLQRDAKTLLIYLDGKPVLAYIIK